VEKKMVKVKIPLPTDAPSGGEAEWLWADPEGNNTFTLRNVPTFVKGLSYGDLIKTKNEDGTPVFDAVERRGGHSIYRAYAKSDRSDPELVNVLETLKKMNCDLEPATDKIVNVDVLPGADIYAVYQVLDNAERAGILEFEEGHCGHPLRAKS
jgi:Domain of unknown function (DUF4265)